MLLIQLQLESVEKPLRFFLVFISYIEQNLRSSTCYRLYDKAIPDWLHNRPKKYVAHCIAKIEASSYIANDKITKERENKYAVPSETEEDRMDLVYFGDDNTLPSCTCFEWKRHSIPCKHIMAVFEHIEGMSWFSLGKGYRESVFFKINNEVLGLEEEKAKGCFKEERQVEDKKEEEVNVQDPITETSKDTTYSELPGRKRSPATKASYCREN